MDVSWVGGVMWGAIVYFETVFHNLIFRWVKKFLHVDHFFVKSCSISFLRFMVGKKFFQISIWALIPKLGHYFTKELNVSRKALAGVSLQCKNFPNFFTSFKRNGSFILSHNDDLIKTNLSQKWSILLNYGPSLRAVQGYLTSPLQIFTILNLWSLSSYIIWMKSYIQSVFSVCYKLSLCNWKSNYFSFCIVMMFLFYVLQENASTEPYDFQSLLRYTASEFSAVNFHIFSCSIMWWPLWMNVSTQKAVSSGAVLQDNLGVT
jgi:hypothetical protein